MAECTAAYGDKEIASLLMARWVFLFLSRTYERHRSLLVVCRTMNKVSIVWWGELQRPLLLLAISPTSGTLPHLERQVEGKSQQTGWEDCQHLHIRVAFLTDQLV